MSGCEKDGWAKGIATLLNKKETSDVILKVSDETGEKEFYCHKSILGMYLNG